MKITAGKLYDMQAALRALLELKGIKASLALRIVRLVKVLEPELKTIMEQRDRLITEHGEKKGESYSISPEMPGHKAWVEAFADVLRVEIDVSVEPVVLPEDVSIAPLTLLALEPLVAVAEGEAPKLSLVK